MNIIYTLSLLSLLFSAESFSGNSFYSKNGSTKIQLISSDIQNTQLDVSVDGYEFIEIAEKNGYFKIKCDKGSPLLERGKPNLPKINTSIIIPDNASMEVKVIDYEYEDITGIDIIPSKGNLTRDIDPSTVPYSFDDIYKKNKFYPSSLAEMGDPYILRDLRGQAVIIHPFQYNPVQRVLRVYTKMTLEVNSTVNGNKKNILTRNQNFIKESNEFKNIYNNLFINYNTDTRFDYVSDLGNMLIISYDDFIDEMSPFVEWKNKKGIPTEIFGINEVGNSVSEIQNFINNYYSEFGLTYLLLVGDINQIPTHIVGGSASDPTFGFIEGNDAFSEIIVGRFSANNPMELITQVERSIDYEKNPGENTEHFNKALGIASTQGPGYGGLTDAQFNDLLWNDFLSDYTYQEYTGLYDGSGSVAQGVSAINQGVGIINYTGHAGPTGWGNGAPLGVNDVNGLTNTNKLPFIFTVGCNPGQFNDYSECFCEAWMRATDSEGNPTGAIGHLGSTISQSWEPPMHGQWAMNAILTESYDENITRSYGGITVNGCMHMNEAQGSAGINETTYWTLFGDPSLTIRTDEPAILNPSYDSAIAVGQTEFVVDVGVDGAVVALSIDGELLSYAVSQGGVAILDLSDVSNVPGQVDIVITSFNAYAHEDTLNVITPDGAFLSFDSIEILSDSNFNDSVDFGDEIEMNLLVENIGNMNANGINVIVSTADEFIQIINGNSIISYAIVDEVASTEQPIIFSVLESVPDGHFAQFNVFLENGDLEFSMNFNIEVHAPKFEVDNITIIDQNQDGVWNPGETATITADLINSGSAPFSYYPGAVIFSDNPYINILSGENDNTWYGIGANETYQATFEVYADETVPLNSEVLFTISWGYSPTSPCYFDCAEQANEEYSTIVGHPSIIIWDPSNQHISGTRLTEYFEQNNILGFDYFSGQELPSIENYQTAFVFLGVYPENHYLQEDEVSDFINLLQSGGNVYMEGADTWAFDMPTTLHSMFGLAGESDGSADLSSISGFEGTFTEDLTFSYNGGNSYVDRLLPIDGFSILKNDNPEYVTAVAYENEEYAYRTIGASHDLGGLQGDDFGAYITGVLEFFSEGSGNIEPECSIGDINQDSTIDVTDIIRQVNIIIGLGEPATLYELCASDITGDGLVNVLDVMALVNIIIDTNRRSQIRHEAIDEALIIMNDESLVLSADGILKGIQFKIKSEANMLMIKEDLNMDVAYNAFNDIHNILIYDLGGNYIKNGKYAIFETNEKFEIVEIIAANSNNEAVEILYENNFTPDQFILKQNYPNPFNPSTQIEIELGYSESIRLVVFDVMGREVIELANGIYDTGNYTFVWNGKDKYGQPVSSGMYIYSLISSDRVSTEKMLLLK